MSKWYINNKQYNSGPLSFEQLKQLVESGALKADEEVWYEGGAQPVPANMVPGIVVTPLQAVTNSAESSARSLLNVTLRWCGWILVSLLIWGPMARGVFKTVQQVSQKQAEQKPIRSPLKDLRPLEISNNDGQPKEIPMWEWPNQVDIWKVDKKKLETVIHDNPWSEPLGVSGNARDLERAAEKCINNGKYDDAIRECNKWIDAGQHVALAYWWRSEANGKLGRREQANADHAKALEIDPLVRMNRQNK